MFKNLPSRGLRTLFLCLIIFVFGSAKVLGQTTVSSIVKADPDPSNLVSVDFTITFADPITGLTATNFTLSGAGTSGALIGTPVDQGSGDVWTVPVTTGTGDGTLGLDFDNSTGLSLTVTNQPFTGEIYTIDKSAPVLQSARAVDDVTIQLDYDEDISLSSLQFTDGMTVSGLTVSSIALNADVSIVELTVSNIGNTAYTGTLDLTLDADDVIEDLAGNIASDQSGYVVADGQAPVFQGATAVDNVTIQLQYSETVTPTFTTPTDWNSASFTSSNAVQNSGDNTIIDLTVDPLNNTAFSVADLALAIDDDASDRIVDGVGNIAAAVSSQTVADGQAPVFQGATAVDNVTIQLQYSETVTPTFTTPTDWNSASFTSSNAVQNSGDNTIIDLTVDPLNNTAFSVADLALAIDDDASDRIVDGVGNIAAAVSSQTVADGQAPVFQGATAVDNVTIQLQYSETVTPTFTTPADWNSASFTSSNAVQNSGDNTIIDLTVDPLNNTAFSVADLALAIDDDASDRIVDGVGNIAAAVSSQTVADGQAPVFQGATAVDNVTIQLQYSETVTPTFTTPADWNSASFTSSNAVQNSGDNTIIDLTVDPLNNTAFSVTDLALAIDDDASDRVADGVGNIAAAVSSQTVADGQAPNFESTYPNVTAITGSGFTLNSDQDENGVAYYVVVPDGALAPDAAEVKAGTGNGGSGQITAGNVADSGGPNSTNATGLAGATDYDVYVVAEDGIPNLQAAVFGPINVLTLSAPVINDLGVADNFTYTEDDPATIIDRSTLATVTDADNPADINGATLTVSVSNNRQDLEDVLSIVDQGTGAGLIDLTTNAGSITIDATIVAGYTGGTGTSDLVITFNANATLATATLVLQNITYQNVELNNPTETTRTVSFVYNDGADDSNQADVAVNVVQDVTPPTLSSSLPVDESNNQLWNGNIELTFNDNMQAGTGNVVITGDVSYLEIITVPDARVTYVDNVVTINPTATFVKGENYEVTIVSGALQDDGGNDYAGMVAGELNFTPVDIVINEVVTAPQTDWSTAGFMLPGSGSGGSNDEYVELYISSDNVDLTGWTIDLIDGTDVIGADIDAGGGTPAFAVNVFSAGSISSTVADSYMVMGNESSSPINNTGLTINLYDTDGTLVDVFVNGGGGGQAPAGTSTGTGDEAVFRIPNGVDTDDNAVDFVQGAGTPGAANNQPPTAAIARLNPAAASTDATSVVFRVTFNEDVEHGADGSTLDASDFAKSGTTTGGSISGVVEQTTDRVFDVTVSGYTGIGTVNLDFNGAHDIVDVDAGNRFFEALDITGEEEYTVVTPDSNSDFSDGMNEAVGFDYTLYQDASGLDVTFDTDPSQDAIRVWSFDINDQGAPGDNLPTIVETITLDVTSSAAALSEIRALAIFQGSTNIGEITTINSSNVIDIADQTILNGASTSYDVWVSFNTTVTDQNQFTFEVTGAGQPSSNTSTIGTFAGPSASGGSENTIDVVATDMAITSFGGSSNAEASNVDIQISLNNAFSATVEAIDVNGNIDTDYNGGAPYTLDITNPVSNLTGTNLVDNPFVSGVASWSDLTITATGTYTFTFADDNGITPVSTQSFDVSAAQSDIIEDPAFDYAEDIDYRTYDASNINFTGDDEIRIAQFLLRDGGGSPDAGSGATRLEGITFNVANWENLDRMAIYSNGGTEMEEVAVTSGTVVFDWGNSSEIEAPDDGQEEFYIYATFKQNNSDITDNDEIILTITFADPRLGSGRSSFAFSDAGGATTTSPEAGDNQVEVTGSQLVFTANDPASTTFERGVDDFNFTIQAQDNVGNVDLDETSELVISTTGGATFDIDATVTTTFNLVAGVASPTIYCLTEEDATIVTVADNDGTTGSQGTATTLSTPATASSVDIHDTTAPVVINSGAGGNNPEGAGPFPTSNILTIQFNEQVAGVTGKTITAYSTDSPFHAISIDADDPGVSCDADGLVTITLPSSTKGGRTYTVSVPDGTFDDSPFNDPGVNGGPFTYTSDFPGTEWQFITDGDNVPPTVTVTRNPVTKGSLSATSDTNVSFDIAFSEEMNPATFGESDILVTTSSDLDIGGSQADQTANLFAANDIILSPDGDNINWTLTITSINSPTELSTLNITIQTGSNRVEDESGNDLAAPVVSSDFIFDHTAPVPVVTPLKTASSAPALAGTIDDINATLSLTVDGGNYAPTNVGDNTWTLGAGQPGMNLSEGTFNVILSATDLAGNVGVDAGTNELQVDLTPPTILAAYLFDHDSNGDIDEVTIEFSEEIDDASLEVADWTVGGNTPDAIVGVGSIDAFNTEDPDVANDEFITVDMTTSAIGTALQDVVYAKTSNAPLDLTDVAGNELVNDADIAETDYAAPVFFLAWQYDTDGDGNIDEIVIAMNEEVDETSASIAHFALSNNFKGDASVLNGVLLSNVAANTRDVNDSDQYVTLDVTVVGTEPVTVDYTAGTLTDASGNNAPTATLTSDDEANPVFLSATYYDVEVVDGNIDEVLVEMSEPMADIVAGQEGDFSIAGATLGFVTGASIHNPDDPDMVFDQFFTFDVSGAGANGTAALVLSYDPAASADPDLADNDALPIVLDPSITALDAANPIVTNVTASTADGAYRQGDLIEVQVTFSESVVVTSGQPALTLETGTTDRDALYSSGTGSSTLTLAYSVQSGDASADLDYVATNSLAGNIEDASTNVADLTLVAPAASGSLGFNKDIEIDNVSPTLNPTTSFTLNGATLTNATTVTFDIDFDDDVDPSTVSFEDFTVITTGSLTYDDLEAADLSAPGAGNVYTLSVTNIALDGTIKIRVSTDYQDLAGNFAVSPVTSTNAFTIDNTAPEIDFTYGGSDPTNSGTFALTINFDESISGLEDADFSVSNGSAALVGTPPLSGSGPFTLNVTPSGTQSGTYTVSLDNATVTDDAGNDNVFDAGLDFTVTYDNTAPSITASTIVEGRDLELTSQLNEVGTIYWGVYTEGATPTAGDVAAGTGALSAGSVTHNLAANDIITDILLAADNTDYDLFLVSEDNLTPANQEAAATKFDVRSGGALITAPLLVDICLEGTGLVLDPIVIAEDIRTDFRSSASARTIKLELPTGFEFDTGVGSVAHQGGADITASSLSYPSSNAVLITYSIPTQNSATLDQLTISGLTIMAIGSSAYSTVTIDRTGGSADVYGASEADNRVFGTLTSELPYNAPVVETSAPGSPSNPYILENATNLASGNTNGDYVASYVSTGLTAATSPITIADDNTFDVTIYSDETLMTVVYSGTGAMSYSPTLDNGGANDFGITASSIGITNFWITVTDGLGCESAATKYSIAVVNAANSEGETTFTVDNSTGTTLAISLPGGYTGAYLGNGLTDFNDSDNSGTYITGNAYTTRFVPSAAGTPGSPHTITYTLTAADGVKATYTTLFVVNDTQTVLQAGQTKTFCNLNIANGLLIEDPDDMNDPDVPDFHEIQVWRVEGGMNEEITSDVISGPTPNADMSVATSLAGWTFNPQGGSLSGDIDGDTLTFRMIVQNNTTGLYTTYATEQVIIYAQPVINTFDNGDADGTFDRFYCENEATFDITASVTSDLGTASGTITTGYTLTYFGANNSYDGGVGDDIVYDFTASGELLNEFNPNDPTDPDRVTNNTSTQTGSYRIEFTTPTLPSVAAGCETTITTDIAVLDVPDAPTLANDFSGQGSFVDPDYIVEYTEGTNVVPDPLVVTGLNSSSERFHWYNDAALLSSLSLNTTTLDLDGTNAIANTNGALIKNIYFTTDHYYDSLSLAETFEGCASAARLLSVQVHEIPDEITVDVSDAAAFEYAAGNEYIFEYCVSATGVQVDGMSEDIVIDLIDNLDTDEPTESYYTIYDNTMPTPVARYTTTGSTIDAQADLIGLPGTFTGWNMEGGQSITFYVSQTNHNNNFPTPIGAEYNGAESSLQKITVEVNVIPDAPNQADFTGGDAQYFLCSGDNLDNIVLTNDSDPRFEWYPEDGNTGTPDLASEMTIGAFNGRFATQAELVTAGFSNTNGNTDNTALVYHYYVRQYTDYNDFTSYQGCESTFTEITITVYPDPPTPIFDVTGDPTSLQIDVCEGDLDNIMFTMKTTAFVDGSTVYNWYPSNDGSSLASATPRFTGATATGVDLAITTATQGASPLYFLISQENNSGACETELASMAVLTINVLDIPSAPGIADVDVYYCEAGGATMTNQTVTGEGGAIFTWYTDDNKDLFGETVIHVGATATEANLEMDIATPGDSIFYVSQNQTTGVSGTALDGVSAFAGCTSSQAIVNVHKLPQYSAPVVVDASICDQDAIPTFAATGTESGALISWFDNSSTLRFEDDATFSTLFTPDGSDDDGVNTPLSLQGGIDAFDGTHTMRVSQTTDLEIEPGFAGCTSSQSTFELEIRTLPTIPTIIGSAGNGVNDHDYCSTQDAVTTLDVQSPDNTLKYRWYTSSTLASGVEILVADDESINPALHSSYPASVTANTNTLIEFFVQTDTLGCLSSTRGGDGVGYTTVSFDFNPLPVINIWNGGTVGAPIGVPSSLSDQEFCYSEDSNDDQIFYADVTADGAFQSAVWAINSTGDLYDDDPTDATFNLSDSYSSGTIGRGEVDNGLDESFDISYTYTDDNDCVNTSVETMTINPLPYMTIVNDAGLTFDAVPLTNGTPVRMCEADHNLADYIAGTEEDIVRLDGEFGNNFIGGSGLFSIDTESNTNVPLVTSANSATFSLSALGDTIEVVSYRTFDLIFSGSDPNGCSNSVVQPLEVQALPEVTFEKISGGCENPAVEFVPETIFDATGGTDGRNLPYVIANDDLILTWEYYRTNADGTLNEAEPYPPTGIDPYNPFGTNGTMTHDPTWDGITGGLYSVAADGDNDVRDFGRTGISETFLIADAGAEGETFAARLRVHTDDAMQCLNNFQDPNNVFATRSVDIEISPNPAFRWEDVALGESTKFYMRETRLASEKIEDIYLFWDRYVTFDELVNDLVTANDTISQTAAYTIPIPTVDLPGEANDVFEYTIDPTSSDPNLNPFTEAREYVVTIAFRTSNDCYTALAKPVNIVPSIDVAGDYGGTYHQTFGPEGDGVEPFDLITSGWFPENLRDDALLIADSTESIRPYSWTHGDLNNGSANGLISNDLYPQFEGSDGYAWHTAALDESGASDTYNYQISEDSWIYSPSFDISGMSRPMVKVTMIHNFGAGNEGAVLQHSTDGGVTWTPLGSYETDTDISTGLDWFDFDNVQADPGQQTSKFGSLTAVGWSGGEASGKTVKWLSARHSLNEIEVYLATELGLSEADIQDRLTNVRFRFAIAATNLDDNDNYFGFALDDFTIQERTKNVMIEQFVSASNDDGAEEVNDPTVALKAAIDGIIPPTSVTNRDEVMLAYHSDFGFEDPFNLVNPSGPSARSIYYNVDQVTSILDGQLGGNSSSAKSGDLTWTETDLSLSSLKDPGFNIVVTPDPTASSTEVKGSVEFIANQDYPTGTEFRAYVVILEDTVQQAVGGISGFGHVMRKLLPSGSGKYVKLTEELTAGNSLPFGDATKLDVSWNLANIVDDANLSAIVFIQNSKTKEIYQSLKVERNTGVVATKTGATVTDIEELVTVKDFNMYPNPTDHEVFIIFDQVLQEDMQWSIFDQTGRVFDQGEIHSGREGFSLQTDRFPSGLYYMSIRGEKKEFDFKKLMITH